ncbi:MAG: response regulator transcription factor [Xanthomonadales bacterium]|nr:response regulator transcription factor [Xanthomonadales bacterium]MCP5473622.1 response regulator transcription factor [Rhodanobacteraceae bacterium]
MVDVLVVEDEPRTRDRLASIIAAHPDWRLLAQAGSLQEAQIALESGVPDVLLLDLGLPDGSGLSLLDSLRARGAATGTLVISVLGDESSVLRAIERGAGGYLLKDADDRAVVAAIEQLLAGGAPLSPSIAVHLMRRLQTPPRASKAEIEGIGLNERELELLKLIAKGLSYEEVGQLMGLKYNTITSYAKELYRKLQVHSRAEAVFEAQQLGLVGTA